METDSDEFMMLLYKKSRSNEELRKRILRLKRNIQYLICAT